MDDGVFFTSSSFFYLRSEPCCLCEHPVIIATLQCLPSQPPLLKPCSARRQLCRHFYTMELTPASASPAFITLHSMKFCARPNHSITGLFATSRPPATPPMATIARADALPWSLHPPAREIFLP